MDDELHRQQEVEEVCEHKEADKPDGSGKVGALAGGETHADKQIEKDPDVRALEIELPIEETEARGNEWAEQIGQLDFEDDKGDVELIGRSGNEVEKKQNPDDVKRLYMKSEVEIRKSAFPFIYFRLYSPNHSLSNT